MRFIGKFSTLFSYLVLLPSTIYAQHFPAITEYANLDGSLEIVIDKNDSFGDISNPNLNFNNKKIIQMLKINITEAMQQKINDAYYTMLFTGGEQNYSKGIVRFNQSQGAVDLGMANVPVLDQGSYGTCVTFSSTAALDTKFRIGDYIDQQCSLALDFALGNNYWHGAWTANDVIIPLKKYGLIAKNYCFNMKYPNPNQKVDLNEYQKISFKGYTDKITTTNTKPNITAIKQALNSGYRVLIGFLYNSDFSSTMINKDGSQAQQNRGGLWACYQPNDTRNRCSRTNAGHEVIIIGYDDNQQLLKIRNSWSSEAGDNGDYYMTYNFFNAMAMDQTILY